jgi:hypothetical protein
MRAIVITVLVLAAVNPARALEPTRQLLESGAPRLALDRVEQRQPRETTDSRWGEWETLRLQALFALGRYQDVLARIRALPADLPARQRRQALALAAQSALEAGQPMEARGLVARALWESGAVPDGARELRLLVIDSYLADGNGHAAFRVMLRFAQDYHPLEPATAARFVDGLLALDMAREAANWLARLDEGSPARQMLRLKAGLIKPDAAIAQSRARLAKDGGRGHWQVIAEAAARGGERSVRIEALEQLVRNAGARKEASAAAAQLWETYHTLAQESANRNHLLAGDDAAWVTYASQRLRPDPFMARAFFAYLAQRARSLKTRQAAQLHLVVSLQQVALERVALRLFDQETIDVAAIDGQARYHLGAISEARNEPALAARFWNGLAVPSGMTLAEWEVRRALVYWRAGDTGAAAKALAVATSEKQSLPAKAVPNAILLGQEWVAEGKPELADASLAPLLLLVGKDYQREFLMALGRAAEASGFFARAGGYFLQAALAPEGRARDVTAVNARLAAALNLARAGYREDARAQFEWVIGHSQNPAELEVARRGLAKL